MRRPKRAHPLAVTAEEVKRLEHLIRAPDTPPELVVRARIILTAHAHPEQNDQQIAMTVGTTDGTVRPGADDGTKPVLWRTCLTVERRGAQQKGKGILLTNTDGPDVLSGGNNHRP